jgi:hypothetical protein
VVAGAARIQAQAGAVLSVTRGEAELAVKVDEGKASVTSPAGTQDLTKNEQATGVPIRIATTSAQPDVSPRSNAGPRLRAQGPRNPVRKVAGQPAWMAKLAANDEQAAFEQLRNDGIPKAIAAARTAEELMQIAEIMRHNNRDKQAAVDAYRRVVESFRGDPNAHLAAQKLADHYRAAGEADQAKVYLDQIEGLAKSSDAGFCNLIDRLQDKTRAAELAMEYRWRYPNGQCSARVKELAQPEEPPPPAGDPPAPAAPPAP